MADKIVLLHGSPATIIKNYNITLDRPRTREQLVSQSFFEIKAAILTEEDNLYAKK